MSNPSTNTPQAQDESAKTIYHTPELVDYDTIAITTQGAIPSELQNGSAGIDAQN